MSNTSELVTLARLRAKTDRELFAIVESALERGLDHWRQAAEAYTEAAKLLPAINGLSGSERRWLETRLAELRLALDGRIVESDPAASRPCHDTAVFYAGQRSS
jgi:hypothetical protein